MEDMNNFVGEQLTENVEHTTEETAPKMYTEEEMNAKVNEIVGKRVARKEAKIRKELESKYGDLENVIKAGTGKETVEDMTDSFREFYKSKGIQIPDKPNYSDRDIEILARAEAQDIINAGFEEVVEEVDRLSNIGLANMTARDKAIFKTLAEHRQNTERGRALSKLGVTEDVYNGEDFKSFAAKFAANTPIADIYDIYSKTKPKKDIKPMGSMKNSTSNDSGVKDFYTPDEARKFTKADFDKNPALFKAVTESMLKWK